jgi:tetratricopeptide (TPR) repeat protein
MMTPEKQESLLDVQKHSDEYTGRKRALIIGTGYYDNNLGQLDFSENDGNALYDVLKKLGYDIPDTNKLVGYVDFNTMRNRIFDFYSNRNTTADDILLLYYSGHGVPHGDEVYLSSSEIDPEEPYRKGFSFSDLINMMKQNVSTKVVTILDCCYSGTAMSTKWRAMGRGDDAVATLGTAAINRKSDDLKKEKGICVLAACQAYQEAYALKEGKHSLFTSFLLEGLEGNEKALDISGNVTAYSLGKYIYKEIVNLPKQRKPKQTPIRKEEIGDEIVLASYPEHAKQKPADPLSILIEDGNKHFSDGKYEEALKSYQNATEIDGENVTAWNNMGRTYAELEKYNEALGCYDKAIQVDPKSSVAFRNKAAVYKKNQMKPWKFIPIFIALFFGWGLLISITLPFPFSLPLILAGYFFIPYSMYRYNTRNSRKFLKIARQLEQKK